MSGCKGVPTLYGAGKEGLWGRDLSADPKEQG